MQHPVLGLGEAHAVLSVGDDGDDAVDPLGGDQREQRDRLARAGRADQEVRQRPESRVVQGPACRAAVVAHPDRDAAVPVWVEVAKLRQHPVKDCGVIVRLTARPPSTLDVAGLHFTHPAYQLSWP